VVLETYARMTPEALDSLTPEERHQFYKMLRLRVVVQPDDAIQISGAFTDGQGVCTLETTSRCCGRRTYSNGSTFAATSTGSGPTDSLRLAHRQWCRATRIEGAQDSSKGVR
jgi:hypothetical protein